MADFASDIITKLGGSPTPSTVAALRAWQRWEGGATNNAASYNWLNRTDQGYPTINSVGVAAYPDYNTGVARTAQLLSSGYPSVAQALTSGKFDFSNPGVQGDMARWLTGSRNLTPQAVNYVKKIAGTAGQNPGPIASGPMTNPVTGQAMARPVSTTGFTQAGAPSDVATRLLSASQERDPRKQTLALMGALLASTREQVPSAQTPMAMPGGVTGSQTAAGGTFPVGTSQGSKGVRELFYDPAGAYDEGKWINPIGGHSDHVHVSFGTPQVAMAAIKLAQQMGLRASENPYAEGSAPEAGVHTKTSYHYRMFPGQYQGGASPTLGEGLDVSGPAAKMMAYFNAVNSRWIN